MPKATSFAPEAQLRFVSAELNDVCGEPQNDVFADAKSDDVFCEHKPKKNTPSKDEMFFFGWIDYNVSQKREAQNIKKENLDYAICVSRLSTGGDGGNCYGANVAPTRPRARQPFPERLPFCSTVNINCAKHTFI